MKLWNKDAPIIRSALETDVYKILMLYYIWSYYPYLKVKWKFKNRTVKVQLMEYVSEEELYEQLTAVRNLRFTEAEIAYLASWGMFPQKFLRKLQAVRLPMPTVWHGNGQFSIEVEGTWFETTLWEIYILPIVAELYGRGRAKAESITEQALYAEGLTRLQSKVKFLQGHPELKIALFGLRRRFSGPWEDTVSETLLGETKCITGISNVALAMKLGIEAQGTNAHELPMAEYAMARHMGPNAVCEAPYKVLERWQNIYGHKALIMLPDTFGTDAFLRDLPPQYAWQWRGYRQDSGDARVIGEKYIADYVRRGIDPRDKVILFTDGLKANEQLVPLYESFAPRIGVGFGIGTDTTNDLGFIPALSIVMKLMEAAGNETVKLSDNIAKAMGSEAEVAKAKKIFGYENSFTEATVY